MDKELMEFLTQVLITTFSVTVGVLIAFRVLWPKVESHLLKINLLNQHRDERRAYKQLSFTAYERLLLLSIRIEPQQVIARQQEAPVSVQQYKRALIATVESEYQHNLTQQLYVSDYAWQAVTDLKNKTVELFRNALTGLPREASVDQYMTVILKHIAELEENPYQSVHVILKKELVQS